MLYNQSRVPDPTPFEAFKNMARERHIRYSRVFISSALGTPQDKIERIVIKAQKDGFSAFSPALAFRNLFDYVDSTLLGYAYLDSCAQVWVLGAPDRNVRKEIQRAKHLGKPVRFFDFDAKEIPYDR